MYLPKEMSLLELQNYIELLFLKIIQPQYSTLKVIIRSVSFSSWQSFLFLPKMTLDAFARKMSTNYENSRLLIVHDSGDKFSRR